MVIVGDAGGGGGVTRGGGILRSWQIAPARRPCLLCDLDLSCWSDSPTIAFSSFSEQGWFKGLWDLQVRNEEQTVKLNFWDRLQVHEEDRHWTAVP